jgi:PKD repeat protein
MLGCKYPLRVRSVILGLLLCGFILPLLQGCQLAINEPPVAIIKALPTFFPTAPAEIVFDASHSYDPDGRIESYVWDFGDGTRDSGVIVTHIFNVEGTFTVRLEITDNKGARSQATVSIVIGSSYISKNVRLSIEVPSSTPIKYEELAIISAGGRSFIDPNGSGDVAVPPALLQTIFVENKYGNAVLLAPVFYEESLIQYASVPNITLLGTPSSSGSIAVNSTTTALGLLLSHPIMIGSSANDKILLAIKAAQHKDLPELIRRIEEAWHTDPVSPLDATRHPDIYELATRIILDISAGLQGTVLQPLGVTDIPPIYPQGVPWVEPASTSKIILIKNNKSIYYTAQAFYYDSNEAIGDLFLIPKKDWFFFIPKPPSVTEYEIGEKRVKLRIEKGDLTRLNDQLVLRATINNTVMALLHIVDLFLSLPISEEILEPNLHKFATFWQSKLEIAAAAAAFMKEPSVPNAIKAIATVLGDKEIQQMLLKMIMDVFRKDIKDPDAFFKHAGKMLSNYAIVLKIVNIPEKVAFFYDLLTAHGNIVYNLQWPKRLTYIPKVRIVEPSDTSISWAAPTTIQFKCTGEDLDSGTTPLIYVWEAYNKTTGAKTSIGTGSSISYRFEDPGDYTVTVTATDKDGSWAKDSINIKIQANKIIPTSLTINLDPSSIPENTGMNIKISGRLTRRDTGQGIGGKQIGVVFHTITMIRGAITDSNGYYQTEYPVPGILPAGSYEFIAYFEGDSQYAGSEARAFLTIKPIANIPPVAVIKASPTTGNAPLTVNFDGSSSYDPDGHIIAYEWSFGDRTFGSGPIVSHTYNAPSPYPYTVILTVTDDKGATGSSSVTIYVTSAPSRRANIVIRASPNPVSIFPNHSEQVIYYFRETNGVSATIKSRVWEWVFIDGTSCCSGAAANIVRIEGFSSTPWSDSIYLPEDIALRAYEKGRPYRVILRTTFHVLDDNGNSFDITFDLLVDIITL